uniref:DegP7 n=1 Tax=Arundo donax TaxID=35708 RepID=A0A0A9FLL1_ARUDO
MAEENNKSVAITYGVSYPVLLRAFHAFSGPSLEKVKHGSEKAREIHAVVGELKSCLLQD